MTLENYVPRKGDRVLIEAVIESVHDTPHGIGVDFDGGLGYQMASVRASDIVKLVSRKETPEEEIARLKEENAKWQKLAEEFRDRVIKLEEWKWTLEDVNVHVGTLCPCSPHALVNAWLRDGTRQHDVAGNLLWAREGSPKDVIAYAVMN